MRLLKNTHRRLGLKQLLTTAAVASAGSLLGGAWWAPPALAAGESVQLAQAWPTGRSPQGFLVSEKFDGVRAVWDGKHLRFRSGRMIAAPAWFLAALPPLPLDGELWMGRGQFDRLSGAVRKTVPDDAEWRSLKYLVFDALGRTEPFAQRVGVLTQAVSAAKLSRLQAVPHSSLEDAAALQARLLQLHPYEVPEIVALPLAAGLPAYLTWVAAEVLSSP